MADPAFPPRSALAGVLQPGRRGITTGEPGVRVAENPEARFFLVAVRPTHEPGLAAAELDLPAPNRIAQRPGLTLVWVGPGQWLAMAWQDRVGAERARFEALAPACSVVRLDGGRTLLHIDGPRSRDTLAKIVGLDLHPRAFKPGDAAITAAGGISVTLWHEQEPDRFTLVVPRSYAVSFWHWLVDSAAQFGCDIADQPSG